VLRHRTLVVTFAILLQSLFVSAATVSFKPAVVYPVGTSPSGVAVGDFNGDGKMDLAVVNRGNPAANDNGGISILLGKGDGTFQSATNFAGAQNPFAIVVGDFNADGRVDLAVGSLGSTGGDITICLGNGDGTFQVGTPFTLPGYTILSMVALDFNSDHKLDLAVTNGGFVSVLLGNGDGTFQPHVDYGTNVGLFTSLMAGDFNRDGKIDLAFYNDDNSPIVYLLIGNGDGTFQAPVAVTTGGYSLGAIGDFNQDGSLDFIALGLGYKCGSFGSKLCPGPTAVFPGNGDGTFQAPLMAPSFYFDSIQLASDLDGDGNLDLAGYAITSISGPTRVLQIAVFLGNGDGSFQGPVTLAAGPQPEIVVAADLNGDQAPDLIALSPQDNSIAVLVNATPAFLMIPASTTLTASAGQQVTDMLTFAAANVFSSTIQLSCQVSGPTPPPTCSLSPASITVGASSSTSTLTIGVPGASASLRSPKSRLPLQPLYALALPVAFLGLGLRKKRAVPRYKLWLLTASLATATLMCTACGGGTSSTQSVHQPQSYTVQVTATSDLLTKVTKISLTVQ
jgi:hypothetical protein